MLFYEGAFLKGLGEHQGLPMCSEVFILVEDLILKVLPGFLSVFEIGCFKFGKMDSFSLVLDTGKQIIRYR